jgi:hypothetical protein
VIDTVARHSRFLLDWVLVDELAIGPPPRASRHLDRLQEAGIKGVLSLCGPGEAALAEGLAERFAHRSCVLPDHRAGRLPVISELEGALAELAAAGAGVRALRGGDGALTAGVFGLVGEPPSTDP